jgi:hypothetical protein
MPGRVHGHSPAAAASSAAFSRSRGVMSSSPM